MREAMGYAAKAVSDHCHKELHPDEIFNLFKSTFENVVEPYSINEVHFQQKDGGITTQVISTFNGKTITSDRKRTSGCSQQCTEESIRNEIYTGNLSGACTRKEQ